ncbi:hypothetical protein KSP39_PZI012084 [Platanthera zijinensis]|uniref:Uncharacterized protein n=1 Tax=Platanthera zijinensis TaxID=2320716 RepID=A0AAP0BF14_9ASPA
MTGDEDKFLSLEKKKGGMVTFGDNNKGCILGVSIIEWVVALAAVEGKALWATSLEVARNPKRLVTALILRQVPSIIPCRFLPGFPEMLQTITSEQMGRTMEISSLTGLQRRCIQLQVAAPLSATCLGTAIAGDFHLVRAFHGEGDGERLLSL